jgi:hypothetical protein
VWQCSQAGESASVLLNGAGSLSCSGTITAMCNCWKAKHYWLSATVCVALLPARMCAFHASWLIQPPPSHMM